MDIKAFEEKVKLQVNREYEMGFNHIREERERKRDILSKVLDPNLPDGQVRIPLLWKNMQLELALFLTDTINVEFLSSLGVLGDEIMKNTNLVAKYDDEDMDLYEMREDIVNHNALYGLSATIIDAWDDDEKQPISDTINPLNLIIDPKNYKGSKLRFIGVERRVSIDFLKSNDSFDKAKIKDIEFAMSTELQQNERSQNDANNQRTEESNEGMADIYDHFNIINGKKYLTTWANDRNDLIRVMELGELTQAEKLKPTKVKFPIQLHRRKPKFGSVFGVSIADEVLVFQDTISILTNLQLINARIQALGNDVFIDDTLGIDTRILETTQPGGRILPVNNKTGMPTQNGIFEFKQSTPSQYTDIMIQNLEKRAEDTTNIGSQNFGLSQNGTQTKAEIQTLQQNANQILIWISNNYLRGQKDFWESYYRCYALNMGKGKKNISLYQKGSAVSLSLSKAEFIADGKVNITITSKSQQAIENDKEFNKLTFISNLFLPNITSEFAKNELLRLIGNKSNVRDFDSTKYIRESVDEMKARRKLIILNNGFEVNPPELNENPEVYLDILKQAMDSPAKTKAISQYMELAKIKEEQAIINAQNMPGEGNAQVGNIAMNNINQQANTSPSTAMVSL